MEKFKIINKTGMRLRYAGVKFEANETKILYLKSVYEHEYFKIEKIGKKKNSTKLNEELEKKEKKLNYRR